MKRSAFPLVALVLLLPACKEKSSQSPVILPPGMQAPQGTPPPSMPAGHPPVAPQGHQTLHWTDPSDWKREQPNSSMRQAQYAIPKVGTDKTDAELVVYYFGPGQGGSVEDNIARWEGQFQEPDNKPSSEAAKVEKRTVNGVAVTTIQLTGTYMGSGMMGGPQTPMENWALLGAIAETPGGPWFFKMTGPAATVEHAKTSFDTMVGSMKLE